MAEPVILGGVLKPVVEELATVYIAERSDGSYMFASTGDEGNARTVTVSQWAFWQAAQKAWAQAQAEMGTVYRSSGF